MYAIIEVNGKQYKVEEGKYIDVDHLGLEPESTVEFDKVLAVAKDGNTEFGTPYLSNAKVSAKVLENFKGEKVVAYKYRRRKDSHKKKGHRSLLTRVAIEKINA